MNAPTAARVDGAHLAAPSHINGHTHTRAGPAPTREEGAGPGPAWGLWVLVGFVAALGALGFYASFHGVTDAVEPYFGNKAAIVPIGVDLGIAVFVAADLMLARQGMRARWVRAVAFGLNATTLYLNAATQPDTLGKVAHAVLPFIWICAVEVVAHVVRARADSEGHATERMDRIRFSRWLLAPLPTLLIWRRMVLWEVRSYEDALARDDDRVLALCALQERWGRYGWRTRAPRELRVLYRRGRLTPKQVEAHTSPASENAAEGRVSDEKPTPEPSGRIVASIQNLDAPALPRRAGPSGSSGGDGRVEPRRRPQSPGPKTTAPPEGWERELWRELRDELGRPPGSPALRKAAEARKGRDMKQRRAIHLAALGQEEPL